MWGSWRGPGGARFCKLRASVFSCGGSSIPEREAKGFESLGRDGVNEGSCQKSSNQPVIGKGCAEGREGVEGRKVGDGSGKYGLLAWSYKRIEERGEEGEGKGYRRQGRRVSVAVEENRGRRRRKREGWQVISADHLQRRGRKGKFAEVNEPCNEVHLYFEHNVIDVPEEISLDEVRELERKRMEEESHQGEEADQGEVGDQEEDDDQG
ncbi:hypothetical protein CRG98_023507 [Punica granatum]|uniref:Uncharacterized protein n=1 Tax=Punica granatum TaxID=22663 RepID=A0A2I0JIM4_PUNGR|nr:hypothetical protein CRG98_023507 [Punica granatum]